MSVRVVGLGLTSDMNYIWNLTDLKDIKKNGLKVFSCFSCGGGSSMGYKLAGYEVIGNCEIDPKINKMYVKNFNPKYSYTMGVQDFVKLDDLPEELYNIDVLDGSPPCSTFSMAGKREDAWGVNKKFREGQAEQVLSDLFFDFLDVVEKLKPKVVVAENVKGILSGNAKGYVNAIIKRFHEIGYELQIFLLNAATMGVPQTRERAFFVAHRREYKVPKLQLVFNQKPILYGEFADDKYRLANTNTMYYERWKKRKPSDRCIGDTVKRTENGKLSGFTDSYLKLNEVCPTLISGGEYFRYDVYAYPSDHDFLTMQSFPQDYDFLDNKAQYVCGMSVPPLMMYGVTNEIYKQWFKKGIL